MKQMIKVDTRVKESVFDEIKAIAEKEHEGNFSLTLRKLIEGGLIAKKVNADALGYQSYNPGK